MTSLRTSFFRLDPAAKTLPPFSGQANASKLSVAGPRLEFLHEAQLVVVFGEAERDVRRSK